MNKVIIKALTATGLTIGLGSCGVNSWNDEMLDGFEPGTDYNNPTTNVSYTLTESDYQTIAKLMEAIATTDAEKAEAKAIATNLYLNSDGSFPATTALPAFMQSPTFPYYLSDNGSWIDMVYAEASETDPTLAIIASASAYTVDKDGYQSAWGSKDDYIQAFTPAVSATDKIPALLKEKMTDAEKGQFCVVTYNIATEEPVFADAEYVPVKFNGGNVYIFADNGIADGLLGGNPDKTYGYINNNDNVTIEADGTLSGGKAENVYKFTDVDGEFMTMQDAMGRYLYMSGTFNSFNVSDKADVKDDSYLWSVTDNNGDGTWTIKNKAMDKWMQYSTNYSSWGAYNYASGENPALFYSDGENVLTANADPDASGRYPIVNPTTRTVNAVYTYDGSKWYTASGIVVLNPEDYTAMGFSNNKLEDAELYLPSYLRNKLPYAQAGEEVYVVYNRNATALYVFDGSSWSQNDNGLETVTGRYKKDSGSWKFEKYIGKAMYDLVTDGTLELEHSYLLVAEGICATPFTSTRNPYYSYFYTEPISDKDGVIVTPTDVNAFHLTTSYTGANDKKHTAPNGYFYIIDSYGQIIYVNDDTYNTFYKNDDVDPEYDGCFWKATANADGTWTIANFYNKTIQYSIKYASFGCYSAEQNNAALPRLYKLQQ
ncbi:MAG: hypothetical protein OSJ34_05495 [Muribaculaceae bacterium]|jgi:hypothetical protein|nr:hypothetical protein [Muribaculaceae bacterium]